jgi:radical SAM superfamily enzyme YgiQ (UPF0313 family)
VSALRSDRAVRERVSPELLEFTLEDPRFRGLPPREIGSLIARDIAARLAPSGDPSREPPIVGFSLYVWNRLALEAASRELKNLVPSVLTFAGGPEITANPFSPEESPFDRQIRGEGETASAAFVRSILAPSPGSPRGDIARSPEVDSSRCPDEDASSLPSPWLDGTLDGSEAVRTHRGALWELARGCPYACSYCYESKGSRKVRAIPIERLERELDRFVELGIERVFVLDPTYNASRDRALALLALIEKRAPGIHLNFEARAELLDRATVSAFSRIPCSLQIGLQSSNPEALKLVNRPADLPAFSKRIALLNEAGVTFGLDLMYGLPGDSFSTFRASLDYALALYPNNLEIFRLAVLPGTALADRGKELGLEWDRDPPYHVRSTPKFSAQDLARAASLARATDVFYTQGRAVTWFLSALAPLKLKPSQFLQDFAAYLEDGKASGAKGKRALSAGADLGHREAEELQLAFLSAKYREKGKAYLSLLAENVVALNGAWTRALAEGEESTLELAWHPEDLFSPESLDLEYFQENACMEGSRVRVFPTPDGPDYSVFS